MKLRPLSFFVFVFSFFLFRFDFLFAQISVESYDQLLKAIRQTRQASTERIEQAVEQEKVREAWETGKLIDEHILLHKDRAEYGEQVMERLSADLGTSKRELHYMVEFFRAYPIVPQGAQLSWSHYRALLDLNNEKQREILAQKVEKEKWGRDQLRDEVRKIKSAQEPSSNNPISNDSSLNAEGLSLKAIAPGKPGVYRVIRALAGPHQGKLVLDLGFSIYHEMSDKDAKKFNEGDFVAVNRKGSSYSLSATRSTLKDLYTYRAYPYQVVDGDTFHAVIDLGFGVMIQQRIRLLRLDAPEILTADGKKAKEVLEKLLFSHGSTVMSRQKEDDLKKSQDSRLKTDDQPVILIQSKELDQHGRPLANVFQAERSVKVSSDGTRTIRDEYSYQSIDQALLDSGYFTIREQA